MVVLPSTTVYSVTAPISKSTSLTVDNLITGLGVMVSHFPFGLVRSTSVAVTVDTQLSSSCSLDGDVFHGMSKHFLASKIYLLHIL